MSLDEAHEGESDEPMETADERANDKKDPDAYIEDWSLSIVYNKAMKKEAIKRGLPYDMYEISQDELDFDMTTINQDIAHSNLNNTLMEDSLLQPSRDTMGRTDRESRSPSKQIFNTFGHKHEHSFQEEMIDTGTQAQATEAPCSSHIIGFMKRFEE